MSLDKFDYVCKEQMSIFDFMDNDKKDICLSKPIRIIEMFAGYGSQSMAFDKLEVPIEHHFVCEFDKYAINSYNAVHESNFPTIDITNVKGNDLNITDTDKYIYFMTYSFPCTDLSVAGKMQGMSKGSGTRSGLLWEVERILQEIIDDNGELPQILFMENVKQVIGKGNMPDFEQWLNFLESIGYSNTYQVLNAKNYGVAQNRERCFMFSFLKKEFGEDPKYDFPIQIQLQNRLIDYLEDEVDEKYYIKTEKAKNLLKQLVDNGTMLDTILRAEQSRAEQSNC